MLKGSLVIRAAVLTALCASGAAKGEMFVDHTQVRVYGAGGASGSSSPLYDEVTNGQTGASLGPRQGQGTWDDTRWEAASYAATSASGPDLMRLSVRSESDPDVEHGVRASSIAGASAAWRDIVQLTDGTNAPESLRLRFVVEGHVDYPLIYETPPWMGGDDWAGVSLNLSFGGEDLDTSSMASGDDPSSFAHWIEYPGNLGTEVLGFEEYTFEDGAFRGVFEYDVLYNAAYGGYFWNLTASLLSDTVNGQASANFSQTIKLDAVLGADGNALDPTAFRFDSGLRINGPVPEPASWMLAALGLAGLGWWSRGRAVARAS